MTREEMENIEKENAIKELKNLQINIGSSPDDLDNSPLYYALDWAIKALEKQSSEEDCINRKAAINVVHKYFMDYLKLNDDICLDGLRSLPSVTPQPYRTESEDKELAELMQANINSKHKGRWIFHDSSLDGSFYECSCCHVRDDDLPYKGQIFDTHYCNYCPNCGADMRESEE